MAAAVPVVWPVTAELAARPAREAWAVTAELVAWPALVA
jgi:hypothetical protein